MKKHIYSASKAFLLLVLFSFSSYAQDQGSFFIRGQVQKSDKIAKRDVPLANATVALYKNDKKITFQKTEKNGEFEFKDLGYGATYKVTFKAPNCTEMFLLIDATIPAKKIDIDYGVQSNFIMYDDKDKEVNAKKFKYPFIKVAFNGKELAIDEKYRTDFNNGIIPEMKADEEKALAEQKSLAEKQIKDKQDNELKEKTRKEEEELAKKRVKIAGKLLVGENPSKPIVNTNVMLVNSKEEIVQTVTTNFMGSFVFNVFLPGQDYTIKVDESNNQVKPDIKVTLTGKNDKEILFTKADGKGKFAFKVLASDFNTVSLITVDDTDLKIDLKGKMLSWDDVTKKPLENINVNLVDKTQVIVQSTKTDKEGAFMFKYLSSNQNYTLSINNNDPKLASVKKILLTDENGNVLKEAEPGKDKDFKFELLPYEVNKMGKMYVDDPWLKILEPQTVNQEIVISENVYFNVNDEKLLPDAEKTLDKVISIMNNVPDISIELSSHTDSQGADDYNLKLSEKRAKTAVDYMVAHGISAMKVKSKGYGETHLLNNCANGVKCTEAEHARNRRLEFKVVKK